MNKYRNTPTVVDGFTFASKKEARRWHELKLLALAGEIHSLERQPVYPIVINGVKVCEYRGDFRYVSYRSTTGIVVEDVKSTITAKNPVYRIKKKLVLAVYGIAVSEV